MNLNDRSNCSTAIWRNWMHIKWIWARNVGNWPGKPIIIIILNIYIAQYPPNTMLKALIITPGHLVQFRPVQLSCTHSQLPGEHTSGGQPYRCTMLIFTRPGTHLYSWVESSNMDKMPCWRTKAAGRVRTRGLTIRKHALYRSCHTASMQESTFKKGQNISKTQILKN